MPIDSVPAYNACNGAFVESSTGSSMIMSIVFKDGVLTDQSVPLNGTGMTIEVIFGEGTISHITNATQPIEPPPAYNACNGAFIDSINTTGFTIDIVFGEGGLTARTLCGNGMNISIAIPSIEKATRFGQGIEYGQEIRFHGVDYLIFKRNPNAQLLAP